MLRKYTILAACMVLASASFAGAATLGNGGPSKEVKIAKGGNAPAEFVFQVSPQIVTTGATERDNFTVAAVHNNALKKKGGMAYGMASDSSDLFWLDVATTEALAGITATTAAGAFTGDWKKSSTGAVAGGTGGGTGGDTP